MPTPHENAVMSSKCPCCLHNGFPILVGRNEHFGGAGGWVGCGVCGSRATPVHGLMCMHAGCMRLSAFSLARNAGSQHLGYYCREHCSDAAAQVRHLARLARKAAAAAAEAARAQLLAAAAAAAPVAGGWAGIVIVAAGPAGAGPDDMADSDPGPGSDTDLDSD